MQTVYQTDLYTLLDTVHPKSILLIAPSFSGVLPQDYLAAHPECRIEHVSIPELTRLEKAERLDLGIVIGTLEQLDHASAGRLLARLRDVITRRFVALVPLGEDWPNQKSYWSASDMLGYGMSILARYRVEDRSIYLFHYAIETYKPTPEWFNSTNWANPDLWKP